MREAEFAARLLAAMTAAGPLRGSPAGRALHSLLHARSDTHGALALQWTRAVAAEDPVPLLSRLSETLAGYAATDPRWRAELESWLRETGQPPGRTHNEIGGSAQLHGPTVQTGVIHGGVHFHHTDHPATGAARVVPRQLRPVPAHFTNRRAELNILHGIRGAQPKKQGAPTLAVICGPGGVGKTTLALRWLHEVADQYPDGQLYADLAVDTSGEPALAGTVLAGFLRAMGIPGERLPPEAGEAAGLFRSTTADRRIAILMDNAVSAAQVRTLLPASSLSTVVVTSRWRLGGLAMDGATFLPLAPLHTRAGGELLRRTIGEQRVAAEADAAASLVYLCAGLPIALSIAAARLVIRPEWPIARVVRELSDERRRLKALSLEEATVMRVFDFSYDAFPPEAARAYRLLGLHPGPDISPEAAAAALRLPADDTAELLEWLVDASILEAGEDDRYRFHDLIRLHARQRAETEDGAGERRAVTGRLLEYYLSFAAAADRTVTPLYTRLGPDRPTGDGPPAFASSRAALEAMERELPNLMAILRAGRTEGCDTLVWQLAEAMWSLFLHRKHFPDWMAAYRLGIDAATRCADPAARSRMHHHLGFALHNLGRAEEARQQGVAALDAARDAQHPLARAEALGLLGMAYRSLGRFDEAIEAQREAVAVNHAAGWVRPEALALRRLGQALCAAGRVPEAIDQLTRGRELAAAISDHLVGAMTTVWLADALTRAGRPADAVTMAREAWSVLADSSSSQYRAQALMVWGEAAEALGDTASARDLLARSRACYLEAGVSNLDRVNAGLERVNARPDEDCGHSPP